MVYQFRVLGTQSIGSCQPWQSAANGTVIGGTGDPGLQPVLMPLYEMGLESPDAQDQVASEGILDLITCFSAWNTPCHSCGVGDKASSGAGLRGQSCIIPVNAVQANPAYLVTKAPNPRENQATCSDVPEPRHVHGCEPALRAPAGGSAC